LWAFAFGSSHQFIQEIRLLCESFGSHFV